MTKLLASGISVSPGNVRGKARLIKEAWELHHVEEGDIVILPNSHPMYALAVMKAAAVICENGGRLSHICVVSMEMGIPCITQVRGIMERVTNGEHLYVDAARGDIYGDE